MIQEGVISEGQTLEYVFLNFFFNCRITALQCCDGFCHTTMQISHNYTYITSLGNLPSLPHPTSPLGHHRTAGWAPCVIQQLLTSYVYYTWCIHVSMLLSPCPTLSVLHCVHKSVLYICISSPSLQIGSSISFFQIAYTYMHKYMIFVFLFLTYCTLYSRL